MKFVFYPILSSLVMLSACHNKPAPVAQSNPAAANYSNDKTNDSSIIKPLLDKNAPDGMNVIKYPDGVIKAKGSIQSGKKVGEWQSFFENGKMQSDEYFTDGFPDGKIQVMYDNGQVMYEGQYRNGKPVGMWKYWKKDGSLLRTTDYDKKSPNIAM